MTGAIRDCLLIATAFLAATQGRADVVELANGDRLHGRVLALDEESLRLESETFGELQLDRKKVALIALGERTLPSAEASVPPSRHPQPPAADSVDVGPSSGGSVEDAVRKLQSGGVSGTLTKQLQTTLPGFASPEVQQYFNDTVGGLATGEINIADIRKDALRARDELEKLKKDLGPDAGAALSGYMNILDYFLHETEDYQPVAGDPAPPKLRPAPPQK